MTTQELGRTYRDGEIIVRQGEPGHGMFVIQSGEVEVTSFVGGREIPVGRLGAGDIFGEMALFEREPRSASVRAVGEVRVLTIDKASFLRRVHEDPSIAYRILKQMSQRVRRLDDELAALKASLPSAK